jgi:hypothetical protein
MHKYAIVQDVLGSDVSIPLSYVEFDEIRLAHAALLQLVSAEEKFDALARNFLELETDLLRLTAEHFFAGNAETFGHMSIRRTLNRRMLNVLSSARGYLDHLKHAVPLFFGQADRRSTAFLDLLSKSYDTTFGYRVMEALRNYSQHRGFPIQSVSLNAHNQRNEARNQLRYGISINLSPALLESDKAFKASVLAELQLIGDKIDLKPLTRDYVSCLAKIHERLRESVAVDADRWEATIDVAIQKYRSGSSNQSSVVGLYAARIEHSVWHDKVPLFAGLAEYCRFLARSNTGFGEVGFLYVSGRTVSNDA